MENSGLEEFVNAVRERSDICEVVSRYVPLNLKGGRFWACCPFHEEKTPSFSVTPDKGVFYCFGCHAGGDVFKFLTRIENIPFLEAVKLQADRLGMKMPSRRKSPTEIHAEHEKDALLKITFMARDFYHNCLIGAGEGVQGRKYLAARGITEKVIGEFKLGYAPNSWDALTNKLRAHGFSEKQLISAGIAIERKNGSGIFDRLRGRVIIPISDVSGKVVAFGGRILIESEDQPKYLNTPETEIFSKGKLLFGLDKANRAILSANTAIVVEGYMDAISLFSAGVENVVASLGTAFTDEHAKILSRYARRIIFCYDSDDAGQRATVRALPIVEKTGADVFVLIIPDGKDPDEFIRKHGKAAFQNLLKGVKPAIDFLCDYKLAHADYSTLRGKLQVLREMLSLCTNLKNDLVRTDYFKKFSAQLSLDERVVIGEWNSILRNSRTKKDSPVKTAPAKLSRVSQAGGTIIKTLWTEPELVGYVNAVIAPEIFLDVHREILSYIENCYDEGRQPNLTTAKLSPAATLELTRILGNYDPSEPQMTAFQDSIKILQRVALERRFQKISREASELYKGNGETSYDEKLRSIIALQKEIDAQT